MEMEDKVLKMDVNHKRIKNDEPVVVKEENYDEYDTPRKDRLRKQLPKFPQVICKKSNQLYSCSRCRRAFDTKTGLLNHMRVHTAIVQYTCILCGEKFKSNKELIAHKSIHLDNVFVCEKCDSAYTDHCEYLLHTISHTLRKFYKCDECGKYFDKRGISLHIVTHYAHKFKCGLCEKRFCNTSALNAHKELHSNKPECAECGKVVAKKNLDYHMVSHTGFKPYQCLYCGKAFSNISQKNTHSRTHSEERPYECDVCRLRFNQSINLTRHKITHETVKSYECVCGKKFFYKENLLTHMRIHSGANMVSCQDCGKKFQNRQCLKAHVMYRHSDEKPFNCDLCTVGFKSRSDLTRHQQSKAHRNTSYGIKVKNEVRFQKSA